MKNREEVAAILSNHGIRPSVQRMEILEYLMEVKSHPSADKLFDELSKFMPTISKATVYNTLNLFTQAGVVRMITIDPNEKRFDGDNSTHGHFRCTICGALEDMMLDEQKKEALEFKSVNMIISTDVYLSGICVKCQSK